MNAFILKRQKDVMVVGKRPRPARGAETPSASERWWGSASSDKSDEREERRYSNGEINRELTTLKRILEPDTTRADCDGLASPKRRSRGGGHNSGTVEADRGPRVKVSL